MAIEVLIVDEDTDVLEITEAFLGRQEGISVSTEADPESVLDRVRSEDIDAVVSDLTMPGLDGFELCKQLRDAGHDLPFILFTGREESEVRESEGADCVTNVVRKSTGTDQYEALADHVRDVV